MAIKVTELPTLTVVDGTTLLAVVDTAGASTSKQTTINTVKTHILAGNAATATKLATPVTINGNSFDGSANITITATQVGLGNVTNESKATMFTSPTFTGTVTIPAGASISGFAPLASPAFTGTVTGVTKAMVGLGNVENTALSTWAGSGNITTIGNVTSGSAPASDVYTWAKQPTKPTYSASEIGLGNVTNESKATMFASPTFTGTVTVPTPLAGSNTTAAASTAFVNTAISTAVSNLINGSGSALDTLKELADALGNDANFASTVTTNLALKAPLASPTFTGTVTIPAGASISGYALLNSPSFTTPTLGVATATTINKLTITPPSVGSTLTIANGKTFRVNNTIELTGTDSTSFNLPSTSGTLPLDNQNFYIGTTQVAINRTSASQTLNGVSIDGNAATATSAGKSTNLIGGNNTTLLGAIGYQSDTDTTTLLSPNTSTTKNFLTMTGTGSNGAAPAWGTLSASDIPAFNLGTTSITFNRASASQTLNGVSIDGNAATATKSTNLSGGNNTTLLGAIGYQSNTDTTTLLSPNTTTNRRFLRQTGDGTNGAAPAWDSVTATDVGLGNVTNESKTTMFASPTFTGMATFAGQTETMTAVSWASTLGCDSSLGSVFYVTGLAGNFTANFTNIAASGTKTVTFTLILIQSGTGYMMTGVQVAGVSQSISWVGGTVPTGASSKVDVINVSIMYNAGSILRVLASVATYG